MEHLRRAIGDPSLLVVSSDAYEGLENAIKIVFPHAEQRECFRHLMENYVKRYGVLRICTPQQGLIEGCP
jgi:transposase-like protein